MHKKLKFAGFNSARFKKNYPPISHPAIIQLYVSKVDYFIETQENIEVAPPKWLLVSPLDFDTPLFWVESQQGYILWIIIIVLIETSFLNGRLAPVDTDHQFLNRSTDNY